MDTAKGDRQMQGGEARVVDEEPPSPWELKRAIERADTDRRADVSRLEQMHNADRVELLGYLEQLGGRLERTIRESAGVPLATWQAHNESVDRELAQLRDRVESVQRVVVGTLLTMLVGGLAVTGAQGLVG